MFSITTSGISSLDPKVNTAVEFLFDVDNKDFKETDLRRYLITSRGLTSDQVDEALSIHSSQSVKRDMENEEASWTAETRPPKPPQTLAEFTLMRIKVCKSNQSNKSFHDKVESILSLLKRCKREVGYRLIVDFLTADLDYCKSLQSLIDDYRKGLVKASDAGQFQISRGELLVIFQRIPLLLKFHKAFFTDLGADIGRLVVRLINFFKQYTAYMRECISSVRLFRDHARDKRLYKCLDQIKAQSSCKMDIYDLIVAPLKRILEYRDFFDKLSEWGDESQADVTFLAKAARRLGRIAKYVELYKERIESACELNKVQHIIGDQCDLLLSSQRRFLHRGLMIRRTTGWKARNKRYIFYLFDDMFLWTTVKGELQNVIKLHKCMVLPSDAKIEPDRKFKVVVEVFGKKRKVLLLECKSQQERDQWFMSLEAAISKRILTRVADLPEEGKHLTSVTESETEKYIPDLPSRTWVDIDSIDLKQDDSSETVLEHTEVDSRQIEHTFLEPIDSMGDFESENSAFDEDFYQQYGKYTEMAEYTVSTKRTTLGYEKIDNALSYSEPVLSRWENSTQLGSDQTSLAREAHEWGSIRLKQEKNKREIRSSECPDLSYNPLTGSNILRRAEEQLSSQAATKLQHSSSLSFRLDNKMIIHPDAESYQIRLIDFVDICGARV